MRHLVYAAALSLLATPLHAMDLTSSDVTTGALFPQNEICAEYGGHDISPALAWSGVPANAKSLAITIYDPDAGHAGWWHWLVVDIPPTTKSIAQGASGKALPAGARELENSNRTTVYGGSCPPAGSGLHHYHITLWALREAKAAAAGTPAEAGAWIEKHAIAKAELIPVYRK